MFFQDLKITKFKILKRNNFMADKEFIYEKCFLLQTDVTIQRIFDYFQGIISKSPKIEVLNYGLYLFS